MTDDFKHAKITGQAMRDHWGPIVDRIADEIADTRDARIAALIAAGDKLADAGEHREECNFRLWAEKCDCGYTEAVKAWKEARDAAE